MGFNQQKIMVFKLVVHGFQLMVMYIVVMYIMVMYNGSQLYDQQTLWIFR